MWQESLAFYENLVKEHHRQQEPMVALFPVLREAGFFNKYYPSISLFSLGVSTVKKYEARRAQPSVYISYYPSERSFVITYHQANPDVVAEEKVGPVISQELLTQIDQWLCAGKGLSGYARFLLYLRPEK